MNYFEKLIITGLLVISLSFAGKAQAQENYHIAPSPWAFSWGVGLGSMFPSGDLGNRFKAGFAADTEINIYYRKAFLMINGGLSGNSLAEDVDVISDQGTTVWPKNANNIHAFIGGNVGVHIFATDDVSIYPFAGIGYGFIEPNLKTANSDPILAALKINSFLWNAGVGVELSYPRQELCSGEDQPHIESGPTVSVPAA